MTERISPLSNEVIIYHNIFVLVISHTGLVYKSSKTFNEICGADFENVLNSFESRFVLLFLSKIHNSEIVERFDTFYFVSS